MAASEQTQVTFAGGVNPWAPAHLMKDDEVQTATNIDFSLMNGALLPRRGSIVINTCGTAPVNAVFHNFNDNSTIISGPLYVTDTASKLYRIDNPNGINTTVTTIATNVNGITSFPPAINAYKQYTLFAGGTGLWKDDGTNTTEWIKQSPPAPTVVINTLTPVTLTGTYTCPDGTLLGTTSQTATFLTDASNSATAVLTFGSATDLSKNGTTTLGNYGVHFINIGFSDPSQVSKISWDYSVGDASFINFYHYEMNPQKGAVSVSSGNAESLINSQLTVGTSTGNTVTFADRLAIWSQIAQYEFQPLTFTPSAANSLAPWAVTLPQFGLVAKNAISTAGADPWTTAYALRINVLTAGTCTVTAGAPQIYGDKAHPLTDIQTGYTYWQTFATTNTDGVKIDEGAPSPPSISYLAQQANATVTQGGTATGTKHGINAVITYRMGGYMQDSYAVQTQTYGTAVGTITDTLSDMDALSANFVMPRNLRTPTNFPSAIASISEAVNDRIFICQYNQLMWSLPGQIGSFPLSSIQEVSKQGDNIQRILAYNPGLIIVNRASVYEMYGTDFETGQYTLTRTGSRRGSVALKTIIRTPFGIPLLNVDGLTIFIPGYNNEQEIPWFTEKYSDVFKGNDVTDPASWKGNRVPALNRGYIHESCATFKDNKLYLAIPTGASTVPNTVFVLDFAIKQAWWYTYPYNVTALLADDRLTLLWAGTDDGKLMDIEFGTVDQTSAGVYIPIVWTARTKQWTGDTTTVLENLSVDSEGSAIIVKAYYDNSTNPTITTLTNATRSWSIPPLNGTFINSVAFDFNGTHSQGTYTPGTLNAVYGLKFDLLSEPAKVKFWRTEYDEHNWTADKLWDVHYADIDVVGTGTVTYVAFVDTTAVMTNTIVGPTNGRQVFEVAFPAETYGRVAYTTYTSSIVFKHFETRRDARNEPAKINYWRTDIESLEENIINGFDTDLNPNGTVMATVYVDNVAIKTATLTGTNRQSITTDLPSSTYPSNLYGRTLYVTYTGTGLKHYKTWFHKHPEPDRWTEYISLWKTEDEHELKVFKPEINCLGNVVVGTTWLNVGNSGSMTAVSTHTMTGTERTQYTFSLPVEKYARTARASYQVGTVGGNGTFTYGGANGGRFKHYTTDFEGPKEPPRVTTYRTGPYPYTSDHYLKTWLSRLDPLSGTVTGSLYVNDTLIQTSTFTGNRQQWFTVGIDLVGTNNYVLQTGSRWEAVYSCGANSQFKHYETKMDSDADPYRKVYYSFNFRKLGGASQLDLAKFWSLEAVVPDTTNHAPIVGTYWWDIDNVNFNTGTLTLEEGNQFYDRIPFPPGARGRLFQFRFYAPYTVKVQHVNIDLMEEGIKSLTRRGHPGSPEESQQ